MYMFSEEDAYDPFWIRLIPGLAYLTSFAISFVSPFFKDRIVGMVQFSHLLVILWLGLLINQNSFGDVFVSAYLVMSFASLLLYENSFRLLIFTLIDIAVLAMASSRQIGLDALHGLRIDRDRMVLATLAYEVQCPEALILVQIAHSQARNLATTGPDL